ncbi:MAG: hypothetical protein WKF84_00400 [Pyrinomonadaceae bacterium]
MHHVVDGEHIRLIAVDNRYSPRTCSAQRRSVNQATGESGAGVSDFDEHIAPIISSKFLNANIPVIAIEVPHPGAVYFGADNYQAGVIGGRALGRWAKENWAGEVEELLLLELPVAGPLPQLRVDGMVAGLNETLPSIDARVIHLDGNGDFERSLDVVRRYLRRLHRDEP